MSSRAGKSRRKTQAAREPPAKAPQPVNVIDGIPDRRPGRAWPTVVVIVVVFAAWVAFLIYCKVAGSP